MKANLKDIIDAIEMVSGSSQAFMDKATGEIIWIDDYMTETMDEEEVDALYERIENGEFYRLPDQHDIHEWEIMREFADTQSGPVYDHLSNAIRGSGAFQRFKRALRILDLEQEWYNYRDKAFRFIAVEWCDKNGIDYDWK